MTVPSRLAPPDWPLRIAASRASLHATVHRWLLHELRNPVQTLTLVPELLALDGDVAAVREMLVEGTAQLTRAFDLLDRAMRPAAPYHYAPAPVIVQDVLAHLAEVAACRSAPPAVRVDRAAQLPAVRGHEAALEHALLALLLHAYETVEEQPDGMIDILASAADGVVRVVVEDNGPGIPPADVPALFAPDAAREGPDLAAAAHLVEQMGGTVSYDPVARRGGRFVVRLPVWGS